MSFHIFPSDKPHYPYELPKGWEWTTIGELFMLQAGKNITAKYISPEQSESHKYPCYGGNGIRGFVTNSNRRGEFPIIGRQGALCGNVNLAIGEFYATEHAVIVDRFSNTDLMWAYYTLIALNLNQYATATAQPGLAVSVINDVIVPIPPLQEQCRISKTITLLFSLIDEIEHGKQNLKDTIKQAKTKVLDLAIHGKLVPQDPNDEPASELLKRINSKAESISDNGHYQKLPVGWTICRLKDISKIVTGSTPSKSNCGYYGGIFPFFKPADLDAGRHVYKAAEYLSEDGKRASRVVPKGTTAICCIGTIGKVGYLMYEGATNQQINCAIPSKVVDSVFLFYLCASPLFNDKLNSESSAVTISIVNKSKIEAISVPLPPLAEQKRIVSKIEDIFAQLEAIETAL